MQLENTIAPAMLHSLRILQQPTLELASEINHELETNPVLEIESPAEELLPGNLPELDTSRERLEPGGSGDDDADVFEEMYSGNQDEFQEDFTGFSSDSGGEANANPEIDELREYRLNSVSHDQSLNEHLTEELACSDCPEKLRPAAEMIIESIDDNGYLSGTLADIAQVLQIDLDDAEKALKIVQSLGPAGVGARNLEECLLLQLEAEELDTPLLRRIILETLPDLADNRIPAAAAKLGVSTGELEENLKVIRSLNPCPGAVFSRRDTAYILPDIEIVRENGEWAVKMEDKFIPKLRISSYYLKMLESPDLNREDRDYLKNRVERANELMRSIALRKSTLRLIAEELLYSQQEFWDQGVGKLKPLTMREVAAHIGRDEGTVSRAVANKYLLCRHGFFELRYFFTAGYVSGDGESISARAVCERIKQLINNENPRKPLSDQAISDLLVKEKLPVARRTVAKYRESMNIPAAGKRKIFH